MQWYKHKPSGGTEAAGDPRGKCGGRSGASTSMVKHSRDFEISAFKVGPPLDDGPWTDGDASILTTPVLFALTPASTMAPNS